MPNFKLSAALWLLAAWSARALDFTWGFNQAGANTLAQCGSVELGFYSADATPTPPFFAYTYPVDSDLSPSIQSLGSGTTGNYQTNYPSGTKVVVGLVDAFSRFGGWSGQLTVQDSSNTACLNSIGDPSLSLTLNTTQVSTCDVVGVQVDGGEAPYTFTVFPINGVTETFNVTGSDSDNYLSWVDTFGPANQVAVGVRDRNGNWAATGGPVSTIGSSQSCSFASTTSDGPPPAQSSSRTRGPSDPTGGSNSNSGGSSSNAGAIAGGVVGGLVALAALLAALFFWRRRKQKAAKNQGDKRYSYHNVAYTGRSSPQMTGAIPDNAAVTPFSLSSTGASQGHSAPASQSASSHTQDMSTTGGFVPPVVSGFRLANPSHDTEETLTAPSAPFAQGHSRATSDGYRGPLPLPPGASGKNAEASASRASLDSEGGRRVVQAQDAGPVETEEIPPAYAGIRK